MRHSWEHDKPKKGYSTCSKCSLKVKTYKIKKGGLARCDPKNALKNQKKNQCQKHPELHLYGMIAGTHGCWNCGEPYTFAEQAAGRSMMDQMIKEDLTFKQLLKKLRKHEQIETLHQQLIV